MSDDAKLPDPALQDDLLVELEECRKTINRIRGTLQRQQSIVRAFVKHTGFDPDGPCPICKGVEGCSHTFAERLAALRSPAAPAGDVVGYRWRVKLDGCSDDYSRWVYTETIPEFDEKECAKIEAEALSRSPEPAAPAEDGYKEAFYKIADLLDIPAMARSPREVFNTIIYPRLQAALRPDADAVGLLRNFPADGKPPMSVARGWAEHFGFIGVHTIETPCRTCGTPRYNHSYFSITPAGEAVLHFAARQGAPEPAPQTGDSA